MVKLMKVTATREVFPWILLWHRCTWAIEDAAANEESQYLSIFSALLCAFTLEAFLNQLLRFRFPNDWRKYERKATPSQKLARFGASLDFRADRSRRPFSSFKDIFSFRNDLAHAKPVQLARTFNYPVEAFLAARKVPPIPRTSWDSALTLKKARNWHEDTRAMIQSLYQAADMGDDPFHEAYSTIQWSGTL